MKPTVQYTQSKYAEFNKLCFEGKLPEVPVELSNATSFLGRAEYVSVTDQFGLHTGFSDLKLKINTKFDLPENEVEDVIIHEMIHLYIAYFNIHDESAHGPAFRCIMKIINSKHGRNITISHHGTEEEIESALEAKTNIICVTELNDWDHGITVCARSKVFQIMEDLPKRYKFKSMKWYLTNDPYFGRFPKANTAKIWKISEDIFVEHIAGATELEYDGQSLKPKGERYLK